jgi:hypothetical protein
MRSSAHDEDNEIESVVRERDEAREISPPFLVGVSPANEQGSESVAALTIA